MRITILAHPETGGGETFRDGVGQVAAGLRKGSHRVSILGVCDQIGKLISGLKRRQPDLVFNMMDHDPQDGPAASAVIGLLDLLGVPYTGCGPGEFYIQLDPGLCHSLLTANGICRGPDRDIRQIGGETANGHTARKFQIGVLGNCELTALAPISEGCQDVNAAHFEPCRELHDRLRCVAKTAYQALRVRDYGFVDVKVCHDHEVLPMGARNDCDLSQCGLLARSAAAAGIDHPTLVNRIAECALERAEQRQCVRLI
jgi:D-alanine-D-alanine ligase